MALDSRGDNIPEKNLDLGNPDQLIRLANPNPNITTFFPTGITSKTPPKFFYQPPSEEDPTRSPKVIFYHEGLIRVFSVTKEAGILFESEFQLKDHLPLAKRLKLRDLVVNEQLERYDPEHRRLRRATKLSSKNSSKKYCFYQEVDCEDPSSTKEVIVDTSDHLLKDFSSEDLVFSHPLLMKSWLRNSLFGVAQPSWMARRKLKVPALEMTAHKNFFYNNLLAVFSFRRLRIRRSLSLQIQQKNKRSFVFQENSSKASRQIKFGNISRRFSYVLATEPSLLTVIKIYDRQRIKLYKVIDFDPFELVNELVCSHSSVLNNRELVDCEFDLDFTNDVVHMQVKFKVSSDAPSDSNDKFLEFQFRGEHFLMKRADKRVSMVEINEKYPEGCKRGCFGQTNYSVFRDEKYFVIRLFEKDLIDKPTKILKIELKNDLLDGEAEIKDLGSLDGGKKIFFRNSLFFYLLDTDSGEIISRTRHSTCQDRVRMNQRGKLCHKMFANLNSNQSKIEFFKLEGEKVIEKANIEFKGYLKTSKLQDPVLKECKMAQAKNSKEISILGLIANPGFPEGVMILYLNKESFQATSPPIFINFDSRHYNVYSDLDQWSYSSETETWQTGGISAITQAIIRLEVGRTLKSNLKTDIMLSEEVDPFYNSIKTIEYVRFFGDYAYVQSKDTSQWVDEFTAYKILKDDQDDEDQSWWEVGKIEAERDCQQFLTTRKGLMILLLRKEYKSQSPNIWITDKELNVKHKLRLLNLSKEVVFSELKLIVIPEVLPRGKILMRLGSRYESDYFGLFYLLDLNDFSVTGFKRALEHEETGEGSKKKSGNGGVLEKHFLRFWDSELVQLSDFRAYLN